MLIAGLLFALASVLTPAAASAQTAGTEERDFSYKSEGFSEVDISTPPFDITEEVLYGHATHFGRTTEYIDGYVFPTSTGFDVDIEIRLESDIGIGTLFGECTGSGVPTSATTSVGVWNCNAVGGTGKFENATGAATVYVDITREWVNFPIVHNSLVVEATGTLRY